MRTLCALFAAIMLFALTGCGEKEAPMPEPTASPLPAVTAAPSPTSETPPLLAAAPSAEPVEPGAYVWEADGALWMVMLRDTGLFTLMERTESGDELHSGEGWQDNGDGTVICGPAQIQNEVFCRADGSSVWRILDGGLCEPILP